MTRAELKNIMRRHTILDCEVENAIQFVQDLLEFHAKETRENEPYGTNTIRRLRGAALEVYCLQSYVETAMEE